MGEREGRREGRREEERKTGREGRRTGGKEGGREGGREGRREEGVPDVRDAHRLLDGSLDIASVGGAHGLTRNGVLAPDGYLRRMGEQMRRSGPTGAGGGHARLFVASWAYIRS
jgi:hypothetical protein